MIPTQNYLQFHYNIDWMMRAMVIDWIIEVADALFLKRETLYLAINYLDRYLSK
jgi:hypothetical protein